MSWPPPKHEMVLILDDYHLVASRAVHEQMAFVIDRMPANLHIVFPSARTLCCRWRG